MDIPLINSAATDRIGSVAPLAPAQATAVAQAQTAAALVAQTTVDLSPLGRFLSAVTLFQKRIQELQAAQGTVAAEADSGDAFAAAASAALGLADSANTLQASSLNGTSDDQSLATLFGQQFAAQAAIADEGDSAELAAIGLTFTSPSGLEEGDVLNVDFPVLQAAFDNDPEGTTALLARAGAAFGALAGIAPGADDEPVTPPLAAAAPGQAAVPALDAALPPSFEVANPPAPLTSDGAFLQELLADTPRPTLDQAAPPSIAEANANFAAQSSVPARPDAPAPPDLPEAASDVAARATAGIVTPQAELDNDSPLAAAPLQSNDQAMANVQPSRALAEQAVAPQQAGRTAQSAERDTTPIDEAPSRRPGEQAEERIRLDQAGNERRLEQAEEQKRLERTLETRELAREQANAAAPRQERVAATVARAVPLAEQEEPVIVPRPPAQPVNHAQQAARDPAIAAAIAAYNLNTGPFAALNVRPELAPLKIKTVPGVETVTKVEPIEDDGPTNTNSRPSR